MEDDAEPNATDDGLRERVSAHEHARELRERVESLAASIAVSEDTLADVYEDSARLRPHAADRLSEAARAARRYADRERRYQAPRGVDEDPPCES